MAKKGGYRKGASAHVRDIAVPYAGDSPEAGGLEEPGGVTLSFAWSHKKITCMETTGGEYYVVEGSGNYGENSMMEQYVFLRSKDVYEFRRGIV